ncbi:hypothetical protein HDU91_003190, partial [Kappamyces sp. JEL0680]
MKLSIALLLASFLDAAAVPASLTASLPTYMQFSAAAYCQKLITNKIFPCGSGYSNTCGASGVLAKTILDTTAYDTKSTAAGYVAYNSDLQQIIVAFRGTNDIQLAGTDLDFVRVPYFKSGNYH